MQIIGAVYRSREVAIEVGEALEKSGIEREKLGVLLAGRPSLALVETTHVSLIPGIGPAIGLGAMADALLAVTTGMSTTNLDDVDIYVDTYKEALRRGHSVVVVFIDESKSADAAQEGAERLLCAGGESLEIARQRWEREARALALGSSVIRDSRPSVIE